MRNAELDTFVSQVKSIADKHGFDFDFTQTGKWYEFNFTGERQNFIISIEDTRDIYPNPNSSYDTLGFDIDEFVRQVNNRIRQAELSLDYESQEDVIKRHQGRKDIEECARDNGVFIRDISKELKSLARQYGATKVKDSKQLKNDNMRRINDNNEEYVQCPNSNLLFYGTKLDINGNNCAIFEIPDYQKFLIRQISLGYGSRDWYIGTRSAMDAETFLEKNPNVTLERLEKDVIRVANELNASWGKKIHVYNKAVFDSKNNNDMKRVRDSYGKARVYQNFSGTWKVELNLGGTLHYFNADTKDEAIEIANEQTNGGKVVIEDSHKVKDKSNRNPNADKAVDMLEDELHDMGYDMYIKGGYEGGPYSVFTGFGSLTRLDRIESFIKEHKEFEVTEKNDERSTIEFVYIGDSKKIKDSGNDWDKLKAALKSERWEKYQSHFSQEDSFNYGDLVIMEGFDGEYYKAIVCDKERGDSNESYVVIYIDKKGEKKHKFYVPAGYLEHLEDDFIDNSISTDELTESVKSVSDSKKIKDAEDIVPLDGLLMIAFKDGQEEDGLKAIQGHANESGELEGVKYETYNVDEQDGVAVVDMCAVTNDANAFVKVLLKEWGVIDAVADLDFKKSDEMQNAEEQVSDSQKQVRDNKDYLFNNYKTFNPPVLVALNDNFTWEVEQIHLNNVKNDYITGCIIVTENIYQPIQRKLASRRRTRCEFELDLTNNSITFGFYVPDKAKQTIIDLILESFSDYTISDSKVSDMIKPAHLRGYAEKARAKRRQQKEAYKENQEEEEKQEVSDSRVIKDSTGLNFEIIYKMNDDQFADFVDEIITIFEWYYGEDMPDVVDDLFTPRMITQDDMVNVLSTLGYEELDKILSAYGANNSYDSIIDELFL